MKEERAKEALFANLHRQYFPMVKQVSLGYLKGDAAAAEDLAQDVFINIWNALDAFRAESTYKTWIYRITVNTCLLYLRKSHKMKPTLELLEAHDSAWQDQPAEAERYRSLYAAIGNLPQLDRLIMMMLLDELSYEEIGAVTGLNTINLRVKIHRIRKKMRGLLANT